MKWSHSHNPGWYLGQSYKHDEHLEQQQELIYLCTCGSLLLAVAALPLHLPVTHPHYPCNVGEYWSSTCLLVAEQMLSAVGATLPQVLSLHCRGMPHFYGVTGLQRHTICCHHLPSTASLACPQETIYDFSSSIN